MTANAPDSQSASADGHRTADGRLRYYGKYRGTVVTADATGLATITAIVPAIAGLVPIGPAKPCLPYIGLGAGMYYVPKPGTNVWIEFQDGDPDFPIWTGCFPETPADVPATALTAPTGTTLGTMSGTSITLDEALGLVLQTLTGNKVLLNSAGITLQSSGGWSVAITSAAITIGLPGTVAIMMSAAGISIQNGAGASVDLIGPSTMINETALVVT